MGMSLATESGRQRIIKREAIGKKLESGSKDNSEKIKKETKSSIEDGNS